MLLVDVTRDERIGLEGRGWILLPGESQQCHPSAIRLDLNNLIKGAIHRYLVTGHGQKAQIRQADFQGWLRNNDVQAICTRTHQGDVEILFSENAGDGKWLFCQIRLIAQGRTIGDRHTKGGQA